VVGLELDFVERAQVGRIRDADEKAVAALEQRQRLVLGDEFFLDDVQRELAVIERRDVEQRHAELRRRGHRDLATLHEAVLDQPGADRNLRLGRVVDGLARIVFGERPFGDEPPRDA
jgi:hypothetical protein